MNIAARARARVLLADDHIHFLESVRHYLAAAFDIVGTAADGVQALDLAKRLRPDVIVLDITMPHCNGFQTLEQLRRDDPETKVVFLTLHSDDEFVAAAINGGACGYVLKSRTHLDLISAIENALAGRLFLPSMSALSMVGGSPHAVLFHGNDGHFLDEISKLVAATLRLGEQVVVVTCEATRNGVAQRLHARPMNLAALTERKQYVAMDSALALSRVMRNGRPDKARLAEVVDGLEQLRLSSSSEPRGRLTVFGDISPCLCRQGNFEGALELERLWNELTCNLPFFTVCSYSTECLEHPQPQHLVSRLCAEHRAVSHAGNFANH